MDIPEDARSRFVDVGERVEYWTASSFMETCRHCGGPFEHGRLIGVFDESRLQIDSDLPVAMFTVNVRHPELVVYPCGHRYVLDENRWEES